MNRYLTYGEFRRGSAPARILFMSSIEEEAPKQELGRLKEDALHFIRDEYTLHDGSVNISAHPNSRKILKHFRSFGVLSTLKGKVGYHECDHRTEKHTFEVEEDAIVHTIEWYVGTEFKDDTTERFDLPDDVDKWIREAFFADVELSRERMMEK